MADARRPDTTLLHSALASPSAALRAHAALTAGQLRAPDMAPSLRALLAGRDTAVAANAAFALGLLRDSAGVSPLAGALRASPAVGREAAWALGEIGAPARREIEDALAASHDPRVTAALLLAASKLRPVPVERVRPHLDSGDPGVVWAAAYAIARPRAPAGVRVLLPLAASADAGVRQQVARVLARGAVGDSLGDTALATLTRLARDPVAHVRVEAVRSLGTFGARARQPLTAAARDSDPNVRVVVAQSIGPAIGGTRRPWIALWSADTAFAYRHALLASAVAQDVVLDAIDEDNPDNWQHQADWRFRAAAAEAGGAAPEIERVRDLSLPLIHDRDGRVRAAAFGSFAPWVNRPDAASHPWRRELLHTALHDLDVIVRSTALAALAEHPVAGELPLVVDSYRRALPDTLADARIAAAAYLGAAWRADSVWFDDSLRAALSALPVPDDALVRGAAGGVAALARWNGEPPPGRPLSWYADRVRDLVMPALAGRLPRVDVVTERGTVTLELFALDAPLTVDNFLSLSSRGFYDGARFHRVVPAFVAQDGDPRGDGNGGPGYAIRDELNRRRYDRGTLGMALSGPDTGGSQYFLTLSPQPHLDGGYTVFGRVVDGMDVVDSLVQGDRIRSIRPR